MPDHSSAPSADTPWMRACSALLVVFLAVLPFSSSVALRNVALGGAVVTASVAIVLSREGWRAGWRDRLPPVRVLVALACWSLWCLLSLAWSIDPAHTASELRPGLLPTMTALLLFHFVTRDYTDLDRWSLALAAGLAVLALLAIGQRIAQAGPWDAQRWHVDGGYYSTHVVLAAPWLAWLWLRRRTQAAWIRPALAATAIATLLVTSWSDNRVVWPALAAMVLVALVAARAPGAAWDRRALGLAAIAIATCVALFALAHIQRNELMAQRGARPATFTGDPRLSIWPFALAQAAQAPWLGHGYGRGILRDAIGTTGRNEADRRTHWHGHNIFLNVVLEVGLVGLALFLWVWFEIVATLWRALAAAAPRRWVAAIALSVVAGFVVKNLTDDFNVRHIALLLWSLVGTSLALTRAATPRTPP